MRLRRRLGDTAALQEACQMVVYAQYAAMLDPAGDGAGVASYRRLVELAGELGLPAPPPWEEMGRSGPWTPVDEWLDGAGLYHQGGRWCSGRGGGHWVYQCRG